MRFFGIHGTHIEDAISLALYVTTKAHACVCPSGYHRYHHRLVLLVPLDLLRLVERE
jgi:hypothetical protein